MASTALSTQNLETLQLLLQRVPECKTPKAREALLALVYVEAQPVARVLLYSILRKKSYYRDDINDLVHDAVTKLILQYQRDEFTMKNVRSYMYLMVLGALYPHNEKTYNKHNTPLPETDDELIEELSDRSKPRRRSTRHEFFDRARLFCDDAHIEESMYEDLDYFGCRDDFIKIWRRHDSLRQAIRATKSLVPKEFYYRHWGALYSLWYLRESVSYLSDSERSDEVQTT